MASLPAARPRVPATTVVLLTILAQILTILRCAGVIACARARAACAEGRINRRLIKAIRSVPGCSSPRSSPGCRCAPALSCSASFRWSAFSPTALPILTGDAEVGSAFDAVHRNTEVADASRDLKTGLLDHARCDDRFRRASVR